MDEWLQFSNKRHMSICKPALGAVISTPEMMWRRHYGIVVAIKGNQLKKDKAALEEMRTNISDAEEILAKRHIVEVSDLNLGDLSFFFEITLPFFVLPEIRFEDFPSIHNLYQVIQKIPEFEEIDQKFKDFLAPVIAAADNPSSTSIFGNIRETWTSVKLVAHAVRHGIVLKENDS